MVKYIHQTCSIHPAIVATMFGRPFGFKTTVEMEELAKQNSRQPRRPGDGCSWSLIGIALCCCAGAFIGDFIGDAIGTIIGVMLGLFVGAVGIPFAMRKIRQRLSENGNRKGGKETDNKKGPFIT